jgi:hypothetical protein
MQKNLSFRIFLVICTLVAAYILYEIAATYRYYHTIQTPSADFMVMNQETGTIPVIQFMDLNDPENKKANLLLMDYAEKNPDVLYMVRPVVQANENSAGQVLTLFAAGLQEKYWNLLRVISSYNGPLDDRFFRENAPLADIDIELLEKAVLDPKIEEILKNNSLAVRKSGIKSTQSLMVGRNIYYLSAPLTISDIDKMVGNERQGSSLD